MSSEESDKVFYDLKSDTETDETEDLDGVYLQSGVNSMYYSNYNSVANNTYLPAQINANTTLNGTSPEAITFTINSINEERPYTNNNTLINTGWNENLHGKWVSTDNIVGWNTFYTGHIGAGSTTGEGQWRKYINDLYADGAIWWERAGTTYSSSTYKPAGATGSILDFGTGQNNVAYGLTCCEHSNHNTSYNSSTGAAGFIKVWDRYTATDTTVKQEALYIGTFDAPSGNQLMAAGFAVVIEEDREESWYRTVAVQKTSDIDHSLAVTGCTLEVYKTDRTTKLGDLTDPDGDGYYTWTSNEISSTADDITSVYVWEVSGGSDSAGRSYNNANNNGKWVGADTNHDGLYELSDTPISISTEWYNKNDPEAFITYNVAQTINGKNYIKIKKIDNETSELVKDCEIYIYTVDEQRSYLMTQESPGIYSWESPTYTGTNNPDSSVYIYEKKGGTGVTSGASYDNSENNEKWVTPDGTLSVIQRTIPTAQVPTDTVIQQQPVNLNVVQKKTPHKCYIKIKKVNNESGDLVKDCNLDVYNSTGTTKLGTMTQESPGIYVWEHTYTGSNPYANVRIYEVKGGTGTVTGSSYSNDKNNNKWVAKSGSNYILSNTATNLATVETNVSTNISAQSVNYTVEQESTVGFRIRKLSSATSTNDSKCINNNPAYSLTNTKFTATGNKINGNTINYGTLTVGSDGYSNNVEISTDITSIKFHETAAGAGYMPINDATLNMSSATVSYITINNIEYKLYTFTLSDPPSGDPFDLTLKKVNRSSGTISGNVSAAGAIYKVEQYYCAYNETSGKSPVATAYFTTNSNGQIDFNSDSPTSGSLNKFDNGNYPYGTYVITETKAPEGMKISSNIYKVYLSQAGKSIYKNDVRISSISEIQENEEPQVWHNLALIKGDKDAKNPTAQGDTNLSGAVFTVYSKDVNVFKNFNTYNGRTYTVDSQNRVCVNGTPLTITTDVKGFGQTSYPVIYSSTTKNYYVKETTAPVGYKLNTNSYEFEKPTLNSNNNNAIVQKTFSSNGTTYSVDTYVTPLFSDEAAGHVNDTIRRGGFAMCKLDEFTGEAPNGTGDLTATFQLINKSSKSVIVNGTTYAPNAVIMTFTTEKHTYSSKTYYEYHSSTELLPYGTYRVQETTPGTNYMGINNVDFTNGNGISYYDFTIHKTGTNPEYNIHGTSSYIATVKTLVPNQDYTEASTSVPTNVINKGTFVLEKWDADNKNNKPQGNANLAATFELVNKCGRTIAVDLDGNNSINGTSELFANNAVIMTFSTDTNGRYTQKRLDLLPAGNYTIREKSGATGYLNLETRQGDTSVDFTISNNHEVIIFGSTDFYNTVKNTSWTTSNPSGDTSNIIYTHKGTETIKDPVKRGSFAMCKLDEFMSIDPNGNGDLTATFELVNSSTNAVVVNGTSYAPNTVVMTFTTTKKTVNGHTYYEYHNTNTELLPYGTYTVREKTPGTHYMGTNKDDFNARGIGSYTFSITDEHNYNIHGTTAYIADIKATMGNSLSYTQDSATIPTNVIDKGTFVLEKWDADRKTAIAQGDADLSATFELVNKCDRTIGVDLNGDGSVSNSEKFAKNAVIMTFTTDKSGRFTQDRLDLLPAGNYTIREKSGATGYLNSTTRGGDNSVDFTISKNQEVVVIGSDDFVNVAKNITWRNTTSGKTNEVNYTQEKNDVIKDPVMRSSIHVQKFDKNITTKQGDATFADIKYAIVNKSEMTKLPSGRIISDGKIFLNNTLYSPGEIVAIITTDNTGNATQANLPYATYEVHELRADATWAVGDTWDKDSAKNGTSKYANNHGYLHTDQFDEAKLHDTTEYTVVSANNSVRDEAATYDDSFYNYPARASLEIQKHDAETGLAENQGINKLNGIRYAIVNRSAEKVMYKGTVYEVGKVIDILETDENGYTSTTDIPYGTYDVYELRQDATIEIGEDYNGSEKLGTSNKANDYYIFSDKIEKLIDLNENNPTYTVDVQNQLIREVSETYSKDFYNAPVRGDFEIKKIDINGYDKPNIPWLVQLLDENDNVVEWHVVMTDKNGNLNTKTRGNKTATAVNTLDQYYDGQNGYTGPLDDTTADVNIWFGNIDKYVTPSWVNDSRGSLLYGHYKITELMCDNNKGNIMLETFVDVVDDNVVVKPNKILVDLDVLIESEAKDAHSDSDCLTISENATLLDKVSITHLKVGYEYRVVTEVWNVREDGSKVMIGDTSANPYEFTAEATTSDPETTYVDLDLEFTQDTTACEPGSRVALVTKLYMKLNDEWTINPVAEHNVDCDIDSQNIYVPKLESEASNVTTKTRIGSVDPNTKVVDKITYKNLGDKVDYAFNLYLKDDNNNIIKDINGNDCVKSFIGHVDKRLNDTDEFRIRNGITIIPQNGTFDFDTLGWEPWEINVPENSKSVYVVADIVEQFWDETVITHNTELDIDIQTVRYLQIGTTAGSVVDVASGEISKQGIIPNDTNARLRDIITYSNCAQDVHVIVEGTVVEKESQEVVTTKTQEYDLIKLGPDETKNIYLDFIFDSTPYAEKKLVVFEKVYMLVDNEKVLIADHSDINDTNQTVRVPDIHTTLNSIVEHNNYKVTKNSGHIDLIDYVTYKNVKPGEWYTLTCVLMDKITGEEVYDIHGNLVTATFKFKAEAEDGIAEVPISFDSVPRDISWETDDGYVAFEELKGDDELTYATHNDINDKGQTVLNPKFKTKAINLSETKYIVAAPDQKITDNVTLKNFDKANENGDKFTLKITAVNAETGETLIDADGNDYIATKTFTWNGQEVEPIDITIDATDLAGQTIVFYENLYYGETVNEENELLREDNVDSHEQSVYVPKMGTMATDAAANIKLLSLENKIKDEVELTNIIPDQDYVIVTKLWDKTEDRFVLNNDGTEFETRTAYHSPSNNVDEANWTNKNYSVDTVATVIMDVTDVEKLAGKDIVVFEYMYYVNTTSQEEYYTEHAEKEDENQTLQVPNGHTTAIADKTEDHLVKAEPNTKFTDTIYYENLIPELEYSVTATLMVYNSNEFDGENTKYEPLKDASGKVITKTITLVPEEKDGTVDVDFEIDTTLLKGKTIVVFEDMYYNDVKVFTHSDITDEAQSIHVPDGYTTALGDKTKEHVVNAEKNITIIDTITYTNLLPNKKYKAVGTLYKKVTKNNEVVGEPLLDSTGKPITKSVEFTPKQSNGTVEVPFTIDTTLLKGEKIVVFEDVLYNGDISIFTHADIEDEGQTVHVPNGHTTAKDSKSEKHLAKADTETTIIDTVWYENLVPGVEYTVTGLLMSAKTGKPYEVDGKTFTNTIKFTPDKSDGTVDVPITINTSNLEGSTIVVFEDVTVNGETVFIHHDLTDEDQSVHITKVGTKATDKVDNDNVIDGTSTEQTIIDTVKYENLIIGKEYTVKGKLVIKPTDEQKADPNYKTEYVTDKDGKVIEVSVTFTAEQANGEIQVPFTIDASKYAGKKLVAFESIEYENVEIGAHNDIDDEEQTITVSLQLHVKIAKADKDNIKYYLKGAEITIFNEDGTIAKDIDGNDCVGISDENGEVNFTVMYQENNTYYAQETKAPNGYNINNDKFEIKPSNDRESAGTDLIKITILDTSIAIPPSTPKTGDILLVIFGLITLFGISGIAIYRKKRHNI